MTNVCCLYWRSVFLPPEDEPLELHDLEAEARLFSSKEAGVSGSVEVRLHSLHVSSPVLHIAACKAVQNRDAQWALNTNTGQLDIAFTARIILCSQSMHGCACHAGGCRRTAQGTEQAALWAHGSRQ